MASVSLPCTGCAMRWFLPKEREVALAHISNCSRQKCPYTSQDISWLMDTTIQYGKPDPVVTPVVVPIYSYKKKHKHNDHVGGQLADSDVADTFPPLLHTRIKFK